MSFTNQDARYLLNALEELRQVTSVDLSLERQSIALKIKGLIGKQRSLEMLGIELIVDMNDEELAWAIAMRDKAIGLYEGNHINPKIFNYLRRNRAIALSKGEAIRQARMPNL